MQKISKERNLMIPPKPSAPPPRPGENITHTQTPSPQHSQSISTNASPSGQSEASFASGSLNMQLQKPRNPPPLPPGGNYSLLSPTFSIENTYSCIYHR